MDPPTHQDKPTLRESGGNCLEHVGTSHCPRFSPLRVSSGTANSGTGGSTLSGCDRLCRQNVRRNSGLSWNYSLWGLIEE